MAKLSDPVTMLKGVGEVRAKQLAQLNIFTLRDLICHFPEGTRTGRSWFPSKSWSRMSPPVFAPW